MRVSVIIPTTDGPARVLRLETLKNSPRSVIRTQDDYLPLEPSALYHAFTQPGGPLDLALGLEGACFDLRLSARVETGRSWELPVAMSHWLRKAGHELVTDTPDLVVWSTGALDLDLSVIAQDYHLPAKIDRSAPLLRALAIDGVRVALLVPEDVRLPTELPSSQVVLRRVASFADATGALAPMLASDTGDSGSDAPQENAYVARAPPRRTRASLRTIGAAALVATVLVLFATHEWPGLLASGDDGVEFVEALRQEGAEPTARSGTDTPPDNADAQLSRSAQAGGLDGAGHSHPSGGETAAGLPELVVLRAPERASCIDLLFGDVAPLQERHAAEAGVFDFSSMDGVCGLGLHLSEASPDTLTVRMPAALLTHVLASERRESFVLAPGGERVFPLVARLPDSIALRWRIVEETGAAQEIFHILTAEAGQ